MAQKKSAKKASAARLQTYRPVLDRLIFVVALLGMITAVHLWIQQGIGFNRGCLGFSAPGTQAASFDCEAVTTSDAGQLFGVSNVVLGFLFYLIVAALSAGIATASGMLLPRLKRIRAGLIAAGFVYSLYLVSYQVAQIGEYCALCLISAGLTALLFALLAVDFFKPIDRSAMRAPSKKTTREPVLVASLAVLTFVLIGADVLYFKSLEDVPVAQATPAQPVAQPGTEGASGSPAAACTYNEEVTPVENYMELVNFTDPVKGNEQADVTVIELFDPNCGHCKSFHPVMQQVVEANKSKARFYIKPLVLWERSLIQTEALYAAAQENKYFDMLDRQFARQQPSTGLDMDQLRGIASEIGMDPDVLTARIQGGIYRRPILSQREKVMGLGINSVPTVMINGRVVAGSARTVECLTQMITEAAQ